MTNARPEIRRLPGDPCELGEGPHYDPVTNTAWWFDILGRKLIEHRFADGATQAHDLPRMGSVIARIDEARQLVAMEDGFYIRDRADGALSLLAPLEADNLATRSNDGRVHPSGRLWIGTMGKKAEKGAGAIYWFDGVELRTLFPEISIPNSICFSPDGATGYFTDTPRATVWRVSLEAATGRPKGEPEVFLTAEALPPGGGFDGSVVDGDGLLWNAAWGGGAVSGYAPDGSLARRIEVPATRPTCPCFVGPTLDRMLATSAFEGMSPEARAADPQAGSTFVIEGAFRGLADTPFRLPSHNVPEGAST